MVWWVLSLQSPKGNDQINIASNTITPAFSSNWLSSLPWQRPGGLPAGLWWGDPRFDSSNFKICSVVHVGKCFRFRWIFSVFMRKNLAGPGIWTHDLPTQIRGLWLQCIVSRTSGDHSGYQNAVGSDLNLPRVSQKIFGLWALATAPSMTPESMAMCVWPKSSQWTVAKAIL